MRAEGQHLHLAGEGVLLRRLRRRRRQRRQWRPAPGPEARGHALLGDLPVLLVVLLLVE